MAEFATESRKTYAKTSTIQHGGLGLFAGEDIKAGDTIIEYTGKMLSYKQARTIKNRTYLKAISFTKHLDGNVDYASDAKYINDNTDKSKHNVKFSKKDERIFVIADRDLKKDEELFVDYGRGHWIFHDIGDFLGLELIDDDTNNDNKILLAKDDLDDREVICVYTSSLLDTYHHGLGRYVSFSVRPDLINSVIRKNPFIPETLMVTATRKIVAGESITVDCACRLKIVDSKSKTVSNSKIGVCAQVDISPGTLLGAYQGKVMEVAGEQVVIGPTDENGKLNFSSKKDSPVCFVNHPENVELVNAEFVYRTRLEQTEELELGDSLVYLLSRRPIKQGEEVFATRSVLS
mmetsp:Transcript_13139/g.17028  ORF Transcript_13139/g.17028 Transcript_13139/m.17028 type:complete len:348 (-) Transcript_13139:40-1083(-)